MSQSEVIFWTWQGGRVPLTLESEDSWVGWILNITQSEHHREGKTALSLGL